jgi:radical SAM/Cys-rich protein
MSSTSTVQEGTIKSLKAVQHELSDPLIQLQTLAQSGGKLPRFEERLDEIGLFPLRPTEIEIFQGETMQLCLEAIKDSNVRTVDLTGGAPEMNPNFRWFVEEISKLGRQTIVRSNLTILTVNKKYRQLPQFFADHKAILICSLPCYTAENTDKQRGSGVFDRSIEALQMLNAVGYAQAESDLELHLVYNPVGASLPPPQEKLSIDYKRVLKEEFGILFNDLYCITNMPISRFLEYLLRLGQYEEYMETLVNAFNPAAAPGVMCRNTISVGWEGTLYDCDFNQMLELEVEHRAPRHIRDFKLNKLTNRRIVLNQHCYGCTAGAGSTCGGEIVQ